MSSTKLVSPLAEVFAPIPLPHRLLTLEDAPVALIDSMLNPGAGWGQALLDGVERGLAGSGAGFGRERRKPLGGDGVEEWSEAMAAKYRAAVIAVGD